MTFIPNYPRYVPFFFMCVSFLHLFNNAMWNKDLEYSMILPITKKDIVKSRCLLVYVYEIVFTLLSVPFSILYTFFGPAPNASGIEGNVAFYGLVLIVMAFTTFTFLAAYYKKAAKPGVPFLKAAAVFWVLYILAEFPIWTSNISGNEFFQMLDKTDKASQIQQLPVLAAGVVIFLLSWFVSYKVAAKRFEKVDL